MANAMVSLNGVELITHADGYTPFEGASDRRGCSPVTTR